MYIEKSRFEYAKKQVKELIESNKLIVKDNHVVFNNNAYDCIKKENIVTVIYKSSCEHIIMNFRIVSDGVELLESEYNGKKCKSDRTLKKFQTILTLFYCLYELKILN